MGPRWKLGNLFTSRANRILFISQVPNPYANERQKKWLQATSITVSEVCYWIFHNCKFTSPNMQLKANLGRLFSPGHINANMKKCLGLNLNISHIWIFTIFSMKLHNTSTHSSEFQIPNGAGNQIPLACAHHHTWI